MNLKPETIKLLLDCVSEHQEIIDDAERRLLTLLEIEDPTLIIKPQVIIDTQKIIIRGLESQKRIYKSIIEDHNPLVD